MKEKIGKLELKSIANEVFENEDAVNKIMEVFLKKKVKDSSKGFRAFLKKKKVIKQKQEGEEDMLK